MSIERTFPGQEFSGLRADDWEQIADTVDRLRDSGTRPAEGGNPSRLVGLENTEEDQLPIDGIALLDGCVETPTQDEAAWLAELVITAKKPTANIADLGKLFGSTDYVDQNDLAFVRPDGLQHMTVQVNDELHEFAYPIDADFTKMQSGGMGYRIAWKEQAGTGDVKCLLRLSHFNFTMFWGVTDVEILAGQSGLVTITKGTIQPAAKYTVYNEIYGEDVGAGVVVTCKHFEPAKCQIVTAACESEPPLGITHPTPN